MHTDKRIIKTRTNIKNAFMELVETTEMSKISVSELANKALVNRSTFYLHYTDVQSVASDIESEISQNIASAIDGFNVNDIHGSIYYIFSKLTSHLEENQSKKRYIIYSTNSNYIVSKLKEIFVEKAKNSIFNVININEKFLDYPLTFAAAGVIDCYVKWVRGDGSTSLEEAMREVGKITEYIISTITNI